MALSPVNLLMPNRKKRKIELPRSIVPHTIGSLFRIDFFSFSVRSERNLDSSLFYHDTNFVKKSSLLRKKWKRKNVQIWERLIEDYKVSLSFSFFWPTNQPPSIRYILQPRSFHLFTGQTHFRRWVINGARARLIKFLRVSQFTLKSLSRAVSIYSRCSRFYDRTARVVAAYRYHGYR